MQKPKFAIVAICRNEAKVLPRLLSSLEEFKSRGGEFCVVDTGSTDNSVQILRDWGAKVEEAGDRFVTIVDKETADAINSKFVVGGEPNVLNEGDRIFRFNDARNHSASLPESDMICTVDCDEALVKLDIDAINALIDSGTDQFEYTFTFSHKPDGTPDLCFTQSKFYDRRKVKWVNVIHEVLAGESKRRSFIDQSVFDLQHWQNVETNRSGYLRGLVLDCFNNQESDRNSHYCAREMYYTGRWRSAIKEFERHIAMDRWPAEKAQSMIFMGDCYSRLGDQKKAVSLWLEAFEVESRRREALIRLAWHFFNRQEWFKAASYANASLCIPQDGFYANQTSHYQEEPHHILYHAFYWIGMGRPSKTERDEYLAQSKAHLLKCLFYQPNNPKYLHDRVFYGLDTYVNPGIEGWMTDEELSFLYNEAKKHDTVCEIGSWKGRSTHALLSGCRGTVTAVDTFRGSDDENDQTKAIGAREDIYGQFMRNVGHFKNLKVIKDTSSKAAYLPITQDECEFFFGPSVHEDSYRDHLTENGYTGPGFKSVYNRVEYGIKVGGLTYNGEESKFCEIPSRKFDMVFIDALHTEEGVTEDIKLWLPRATNVICGHDYCAAWPGVVKAVDEAFGKPDEVHGSIWVKRLEPTVDIIIPTLGRPDGLDRCMESIKKLDYPKDRINVIIEPDECHTVPEKVEMGAKKGKGEWICYAANDMEFETDSLRKAIKAGIAERKGLVAFGGSELLPDRGNVCEHFVIRRDLIPKLEDGLIFHLSFAHVGCDNYLWAQCEKLGEAMRCDEAKVKHFHFSHGSGVEYDEVYKRGWSHAEEDRKNLSERLAKLG